MLACVGIAVIAALVRYPAALSELREAARDNAAQSYTDREIAGGNSAIPSQELMYQARARIGDDETYEVVVGEALSDWPGLTEHAPAYARYFLMPSRPAAGAPWVLCLNCELESVPGEIVWENEDDGVALVRRAG